MLQSFFNNAAQRQAAPPPRHADVANMPNQVDQAKLGKASTTESKPADSPVSKALQNAGIDIKDLPKEVINSPELLKTLTSKGLIAIQESDPPESKRQVANIVDSFKAEHASKDANAKPDLTNTKTLESVTDKLLEALNGDKQLQKKTSHLQSQLKATFNNDDLSSDEKLQKAKTLLSDIAKAVPKPPGNNILTSPADIIDSYLPANKAGQVIEGVANYIGQTQLAKKVDAELLNVQDEASGIVVDTGKRNTEVSKKLTQLEGDSTDPDKSKITDLKKELSKIGKDEGLSRVMQSETMAAKLKDVAGGLLDPSAAKELKSLAAGLLDGASNVEISAAQKQQLSKLSDNPDKTAQSLTSNLGMVNKNSQELTARLNVIDDLLVRPDMSKGEKISEATQKLQNEVAKNPLLSQKQNHNLKAQIEDLSKPATFEDRAKARVDGAIDKLTRFESELSDPDKSEITQLKNDLQAIKKGKGSSGVDKAKKAGELMEQVSNRIMDPTVKSALKDDTFNLKNAGKPSIDDLSNLTKAVKASVTDDGVQTDTGSTQEKALKGNLEVIKLNISSDELSTKEKVDAIKKELEEALENPILNHKNNKDVKASLQKLSDEFGKKQTNDGASTGYSYGFYNSASIKAGENGPEISAKVSQKAFLAKLSASVELKQGEQSATVDFTSPPIAGGPGARVSGGASKKTEKDDDKVTHTSDASGKAGMAGLGAVTDHRNEGIGAMAGGGRTKKTEFADTAQMASNMPFNDAAVSAAVDLPGSKLKKETVATFNENVSSLNAMRDESPALSTVLQSLGAIDKDLKTPEGFIAKAPSTSTSVKAGVEGELKVGSKVITGGGLEVTRTWETKAGDRVGQLQQSDAFMKANLEKYDLGNVADLLDQSKQLPGGAFKDKVETNKGKIETQADGGIADLKNREEKKAEVKQMILDNLEEQRNYVELLRKTSSTGESKLMPNMGNSSALTNLRDHGVATAKKEKANVEDKMGTKVLSGDVEAKTLDKMLVKHAALMQTYNNLAGVPREPDKPQITAVTTEDLSMTGLSPEQKKQFEALDPAKGKGVEERAAAESDFQALLKTANEEMMSPNASVSNKTLAKLQRTNTEAATTAVDLKLTVGQATVDAKVEIKPKPNKDEPNETKVTIDTKNIASAALDAKKIPAAVLDNLKGQLDVDKPPKSELSALNDNFRDAATLELGFKGKELTSWSVSGEVNAQLDGQTKDLDFIPEGSYPNLKGTVKREATKLTADDKQELKDKGMADKDWKSETTVTLSGNMKLGNHAADIAKKATGAEDGLKFQVLQDFAALSGGKAEAEVKLEDDKFKSAKVEATFSPKITGVAGEINVTHNYSAGESANGDSAPTSDTKVTLKLSGKLDDVTIDAINKATGMNLPHVAQMPKDINNPDSTASDPIKGNATNLLEVEISRAGDGPWQMKTKNAASGMGELLKP